MMTTIDSAGIGERRLAENRRRFRRLILSGLWLGGGIGLVTGFVTGFTEGWQKAGGAWIGWLIWPAIAVSLVLVARYCHLYFRRIDELDLQDNLWSSLIGFYVSFCAVPVWAMLHRLDQLPAPGQAAWTIWGIAAVASIVAYGWRKLRHRF